MTSVILLVDNKLIVLNEPRKSFFMLGKNSMELREAPAVPTTGATIWRGTLASIVSLTIFRMASKSGSPPRPSRENLRGARFFEFALKTTQMAPRERLMARGKLHPYEISRVRNGDWRSQYQFCL